MPQTLVLNSDLGYYCYKFKGWTRDPRIITTSDLLQAGDTIEHPLSDIHLYAVWDKQLTVHVDPNSYTITIKPEYADVITNLRIPSFVNGIPVYEIPENFNTPNLCSVILPKTLHEIDSNAFKAYKGTITFPTQVNHDYGIGISPNAFDNACEIDSIYLPATVKYIAKNAFKCVTTFYCEYTEGNTPAAWQDGWYTEGSLIYWEVSNG
jgi:hypothetical protein